MLRATVLLSIGRLGDGSRGIATMQAARIETGDHACGVGIDRVNAPTSIPLVTGAPITAANGA